jgi:hypothetical protein
MMQDYTMYGKVNVLYTYYDSSVYDEAKQQHNTAEDYRMMFRKLNRGIFRYYGKDGNAMLDAFTAYSVEGKTVIIWGLAGCNCEALAVWKNAAKVYVVDYNKPLCDHERIETLTHEELAQKGIKADFAVSYSSFEHDGLGRYGDPLRFDGDLHAMQAAHDHLKDNGILFFGVPMGADCVVWNAHRIYGRHRLPLMLKGFRLLDVFDANPADTPEYPFDLPLGEYHQNVMVLQRSSVPPPPPLGVGSKPCDSAQYSSLKTWQPKVYETISKVLVK